MGDVREKAVPFGWITPPFCGKSLNQGVCLRNGVNSIFSAERQHKTQNHGTQEYEIEIGSGRRAGPDNGKEVKYQLSAQMLQQQK